jgi:hypothetical protein
MIGYLFIVFSTVDLGMHNTKLVDRRWPLAQRKVNVKLPSNLLIFTTVIKDSELTD